MFIMAIDAGVSSLTIHSDVIQFSSVTLCSPKTPVSGPEPAEMVPRRVIKSSPSGEVIVADFACGQKTRRCRRNTNRSQALRPRYQIHALTQ